MSRCAWACVLFLAAAGCDRGSDPSEPEEAVETPPPAEATPSEAVDPRTQAAPPAEPPASDTSVAEPVAEKAAEASVEKQAVEKAAPSPARDLAAELRNAVGSPVDCVQDYRPAAAKTIRVSISAVVRPSGLLIEPSASGAGLSRNDQRCIEQRVGQVVLEPLAGPGSEPVSTYIELRYEPPVVESDLVAPPPPPPENVVPSLPKKKPIAPSGVPIEGPAADPIEGPDGVPIDGPSGVPIEGPRPVPIKSN